MPLSAATKPDDSPLFRQIVDHLRQQIVDGQLVEHAALPSERAVADHHGVSRMTARRALEAVESEGLAYSEERRGRFVSPKRLRYDIGNKVSFAADAQSSRSDLEIELISKRETTADDDLAHALAVSVGEPLFEYTRLFSISGHATFIETEYVVARRFPGLLDHDLCQSTTRLLERSYDTYAHTGDIIIRMRAVRGDEAGLLGLAVCSAVLELEQVIRDDAGDRFCFDRQVWRGELAEFSAQAIVSR